mmetsp:Transcript_9617/g.18290  ORF Transcript_9617/g.18290 Transcript_9617/m.18290 type:complete len:645 (-) Transcript_9617:72-2006(-)
MMLLFLLMCYLLPTRIIGVVGTEDSEESIEDAPVEGRGQEEDSEGENSQNEGETAPLTGARGRRAQSPGSQNRPGLTCRRAATPKSPNRSQMPQTSLISSKPLTKTCLPSFFSVRIESIQPSKNLDILIKEIWEFGEIVDMTLVLNSGRILLIHFANDNIDPVSIEELKMNEYSGKVPVDKYAEHYLATEARVEALCQAQGQIPHPDRPQWPSTNIVLEDALLCYVTFMDPESADECIKQLRGCFCWCSCLNFTRWCRGFQMSAARPKEPSDILWSNLTYSWGNRALRRLISLVVAIGLVSANVYTLLSIQRFRYSHKISQVEAVFLGVCIVTINELLKFALRILAYLEKHYSVSALDTSIARSKFLVEVANNIFIIILLFGVPGTTVKASWYSSGGVVVIAILASDAVVPNLIQFFHPKTRLMRIVSFYRAKSQRELNMWFEEPKMELWVRYTGLLGSNFITLWFASAVPLVLPISALAVFFQFFTEKYNVLRQYQRPVMLDNSMAKFVRHMLPLAVLCHCVFALLVYRDPFYEKIFEMEYWGQWKLSDFGKAPVLTPAQYPILALAPITVLFILFYEGSALYRVVVECFFSKKAKTRYRTNYRAEFDRDCENYTREAQKAFCYTEPIQIYPRQEAANEGHVA